MDTIIRENPHLLCIEHAVLPTAAPKLNLYQRVCTRVGLMVEDFVARWFCCVPSNMVDDWEFDVKVRQTVVATQYDDVDFADVVEYFNLAAAAEEAEREFAIQEGVGELLENKASRVYTAGPVTAVNEVHKSFLPDDEESREIGQNVVLREVRLSRKLKARRRRKRVIAYVVVALINKVRCKYYHMEDNPANRRLIGSYLLKLMREHNFRTSDIHPHVDYAVDLYFEMQTSKMKVTAYARS